MLAFTLLALFPLLGLSTAGYVLQDDYTASNFFSMFDFFTAGDPTHGFVNYVDQGTASGSGLIAQKNGGIYIGVDHTNVAPSGRASVRLTSKNSYNKGLIILDLAHMPGSVCGTWPAFWTVGPNWPAGGEIDIIEGVNSQHGNAMTLHTANGCTVSNTGGMSGTLSTSNCYVNAAGQANNAGCGVTTSNGGSYGDGFNSQGGGVYAMEWTSNGISIWFFPRSAVPGDIANQQPNPSGWGLPTARFAGGCNFNTMFQNQQIVFDNTFCGDWAGNVWSSDSVCSGKAASCQAFVQNNPGAFAESYWQVNSLRVYQNNGQQVQVAASANAGNTPPISSQQAVIPSAISTTSPSPAGPPSNPAIPAKISSSTTSTSSIQPATSPGKKGGPAPQANIQAAGVSAAVQPGAFFEPAQSTTSSSVVVASTTLSTTASVAVISTTADSTTAILTPVVQPAAISTSAATTTTVFTTTVVQPAAILTTAISITSIGSSTTTTTSFIRPTLTALDSDMFPSEGQVQSAGIPIPCKPRRVKRQDDGAVESISDLASNAESEASQPTEQQQLGEPQPEPAKTEGTSWETVPDTWSEKNATSDNAPPPAKREANLLRGHAHKNVQRHFFKHLRSHLS